MLVGLSAVALSSSKSYVGEESLIEAYEVQRTAEFSVQGGGSNFEAPSITSPIGVPAAIVTSNFRPFPWETSGILQRVAALEGVLIVGLLVSRFREVLRAVAAWRTNGMVMLILGSFFGISLILSALPNFGLLARQRTQVLPFLLMIPAMVRRPPGRFRRGRRSAPQASVQETS
jgi:hypothetical protein